ncbi:MAG: hypothetical protein FWH05_08865 [Oscillospiraceae bacterium]|nr:hypothetical protein [Oscillospiraceae bacterium]
MEVYRSSLAPFGNSRGVIFPQELLKSSRLFEAEKKKIPVDIIETDEGFLVKPIPEWSQKRQYEGVLAFMKGVANLSDEENRLLPEGDDFERKYRLTLRHNEMEDEI